MGKMYLYNHIKVKVLKAIHEAYDLKNVKDDLDRIKMAVNGIYVNNDYQWARKLDTELREKYMVNSMLEAAEKMLPTNVSFSSNNRQQDDEGTILIKRLEQDHCGILCDIALKKGIIHKIEEFIEKVE